MPHHQDLPAAKAAWIRALCQERRAREAERVYVLEGPKPLREVLDAAPHCVRALVVTPTFLDTCSPADRRRIVARPDKLFVCRDRTFKKLADVVTPTGILGILEQPTWREQEIFARPRVLGLFGERLQDPTNVGTLIRAAAAFQLDALWLSADSADVFSPKVVRASTGLVRRLPVFSGTAPAVFAQHGCALLAAELPGRQSQSLTAIAQIPSRAAIAIGNESTGLSPDLLRLAALRFHIPIASDVDSLNVATSAAIAMFYFRQLSGRT